MSDCVLFGQMTTTDALADGFRRVKRNKGGPGGDGETIARFEADLDGRLAALQRALRDFTYRPGPMRRYPIDKPSGGVRWIAVPCLRDRVAQSAAATVLSARIDPHLSAASFAYRPGQSVETAAGAITAHRLQGFVHVAEGDIADFFGSVPHAAAIAALRPYAGYPFLRLAGLWLRGFSPTGHGLPQGSPLSPVLANLVLDPVDREVETRRTRLIRYADDFLLMARTPEAAEAGLGRMRASLGRLGLSLKAEKTRLARVDEGVHFLGLRFSGDSVARA